MAYGTKDKGSVTEEDQIRFNKLVVKGKELASQGKVKLALECNKQALAIYQSEKLLKRTEKMEVELVLLIFPSRLSGAIVLHAVVTGKIQKDVK